MKSPGTASAKTSGKKAKKAASKSGGKWPGKGELGRERRAERREYKGEARREDASARREEADARHREAEAAHYEAEGKRAEREGYKKEAEYDFAKARREEAEARHDAARARHNQAKARTHRHKAARVGLAQPPTFSPESCRFGPNLQPDLHLWILGGNGWHQGCAAVALANHLYASTGLRVSAQDVLGLYRLTADDPAQGASIQATLEAAAEYGLGGMRSAFQLCAPNVGMSGSRSKCALILDLRLQQAQRHQPVWDAEPSPDWGAHAGLLASDRVITWGQEIPVTEDFLARQVVGAWSVEWMPTRPRRVLR